VVVVVVVVVSNNIWPNAGPASILSKKLMEQSFALDLLMLNLSFF
jgi:hypothetical protein